MPASEHAPLQSFLESRDDRTLVAVLLELAQDRGAVRERLACLLLSANPAKLAAVFRRTLRAGGAQRFLEWNDSRAFAGELQAWLAQVERELLPRDPAATLELAEAFIASDAAFFERADDSDGEIASAIEAGCRLWLRAASKRWGL